MSSSTRVFLFGDQTYDFASDLTELIRTQDNPLLTAFLDQAHYVIRAEMSQALPLKERKASRTSNLAHLLHKYKSGDLSPAFQTALSCVCQLGTFIKQYGRPGRPYPSANDAYVLGLCTGSLAAAAVSTSSSLSELLPAAVQTVQVAFRLGLCVVDLRDRIEPCNGAKPRPWSTVFPGLTSTQAQAKLEAFGADSTLPPSSQPWIGATAAKATTISAPPRVLALLKTSPHFAELRSKDIPVYVPSHSRRLFTQQNVTDILEPVVAANWSAYTAKIPVISSASGKISWAGTFVGLLEKALGECILECFQWDMVVKGFPEVMRSRGIDSVTITPIATTAENNLVSNLQDVVVQVDRENFDMAASTTLPSGKAKLAIVGYSGRFPEAQSPAAFWDVVYQGIDTCKEVPKKRWNVDTHVDPSGKGHNKGATKWGCWLDFAGQFDPRFFSISPKEAPQMDPAQRMALMSTFEAMELGGIVPDNTPSTQRDRIGVFHGVTSNDWMETNTAQDIDTYFITGGNRGFIPGRINFCFEFCGPSFTNDTACSSSLAAMHLACNSLWRGDCDTAIAGGTNMIFTPDGHTGLDKGFFLSRTGNCKPFDDNADGYCRAEGVGTVFIKRLEDAIADKDPIFATILDIKTNHSAMSDSMTRPHVGAQMDNMNAVLNNACVDPRSLSYIEMHGTGTQVGDAVEMESVLNTFAPNEQFRTKDEALWVGSVKANIGHGEGVSGVTSLAKVLLMMKHNIIPPHCGIKPGSKINHNYPDLAARNVHIAFKPTPWERNGKPRRALINNFSAAGGNTALLLEDGPIAEALAGKDPRTTHVLPLSGHVAPSLKKNMQLLLEHITREETNGLSLDQLAYTLSARRVHHLFRVSLTGSSISEVKAKLAEAIACGDGATRAKAKPGVLFCFTGQGSQYMGMGRVLYDAFPRFKSDIQRHCQLAQIHGFTSFQHIFETKTGDIQQFPPMEVQLALCSVQMALSNLLQSLGAKPSAVVGHSLGEYAALNTAGVLSESDALFLVGKRAELLQEYCNRGTHAMLAVKAPSAKLQQMLTGKKYDVACINGPEDTVLSGSNEQIDAIRSVLSAQSIKTTLLKVPFAFHSAQVEPILEQFKKVAAAVTFSKPQLPVLSPLNGEIIKDEGIVGPDYLANHCRQAVNMTAALLGAKAAQLINDKTMAVEIGPQPTVCGMVKSTLGSSMAVFPTLHPVKDVWTHLSTLLGSLYSSSHDINWFEWHKSFEACQRVIELPAYAWDLKEYFIPYEGDWCLHRHEILCTCANADGPPNHTGRQLGLCPPKDHQGQAVAKATPKTAVVPEKAAPPAPPQPESTNVHKIVEETIEALRAKLVADTDVSRPDCSRVAAGHEVNNIALTTPSFYCDIAFILGEYLMKRIRPGRPATLDVANLVVDKAFIPHRKGPQVLRTLLSVSWPPKAAGSVKAAKCEFFSVDDNGKSTTKHAWCDVRFADDSLLKEVTKKVPSYLEKISRMREGVKKGEFVTYNRAAGYKLMSTLATFHPDYKLLDKLILDEPTLEACSKLNFSSVQPGGKFAAHPGYIDAITQVGGFAMNAKDSTDLDKITYVNHGWESFQIFDELKHGRDYEVYVQMHHHAGDLYHGDTVVLDGNKPVAFFKGVSLREVPRKALRMVLEQSAGKNSKKAPTKTSAPLSRATTAPAAPKTPSEAIAMPQSAPTPTPAPAPASTPKVQTPAPQVKTAPVKAVEAQPAPPKKAAVVDNVKVTSALAIVSEESGVALEELTDESNFADIGVDSLLSMVIGSRFREELDLDLDADFSIFVDLPTVKELKVFLGGADTSPEQAEDVMPAVNTETEQETSPALTLEPETVVAAPIAQAVTPAEELIMPAALTESEPAPAKEIAVADPQAARTVEGALQIISEESGIAFDELNDESNFADVGVDSLLSMVIGSRFREELGLDLDADFSIFVDWPTVKDLKRFLLGSAPYDTSSEAGSWSDLDAGTISTGGTTPDELAVDETPQVKREDYCKPATSVILQGIPAKASKTIFMLPDGSGSASSYVGIPKLQGDYAVVGLNCPYAREPENMKCTHVTLIKSFCSEIRRRQPNGPYHLGGWSSGGAFAFVCAEELINQGEEVRGLVIIDAPVPQVMEHLPRSFYEYTASLGLFGHDTPPSYLIPHFAATVDAMMPYKVAPLKTKHMPKTGVIWATDTVLDEKDAPPMKGMHFMIQKRTDFGPDGWDTVLPGAEFILDRVEGGNHFTLLVSRHFLPFIMLPGTDYFATGKGERSPNQVIDRKGIGIDVNSNIQEAGVRKFGGYWLGVQVQTETEIGWFRQH